MWLKLLVTTFIAPGQPLVSGIDPTIERRWGREIAAQGIYRDAARSSKRYFVKASRLRWISLMLLTPIPKPFFASLVSTLCYAA